VRATKLFHKGFVQALAGIGRKWRWFGIAVDLNRLLAGIYHDAAVLALAEVLLDGGAKRGVERLVQVIG
jgi:hypothetical protein